MISSEVSPQTQKLGNYSKSELQLSIGTSVKLPSCISTEKQLNMYQKIGVWHSILLLLYIDI